MRCFVIMPYGSRESDPGRKQDLDALYEDVIRPAVEAVAVPGNRKDHVRCHRGDKEPRPGEIIAHIIENLVVSELAIADLTGRNPNVFYELGVRHAVNDNTILISQNEEDVPFDLRGQRLILYKHDFAGAGRLRADITRAVEEMIRDLSRIDNPVRRFLFERERDKVIEEIKTQGRPPGYDFVNELLQAVSNLRKDFEAQREEMRYVMNAVTAPAPVLTNKSAKKSVGGLRFLEGSWHAPETDSHYYARIVKGELLMPYCYGGNGGLTSHFFNFRRIGNSIVARFQWFANENTSGYALATIEGTDRLVGSWWYSSEIADEVHDITRLSRSSAYMHPWDLRRLPDRSIPKWAMDYFREREDQARRT